jgi:hypothetical protein
MPPIAAPSCGRALRGYLRPNTIAWPRLESRSRLRPRERPQSFAPMAIETLSMAGARVLDRLDELDPAAEIPVLGPRSRDLTADRLRAELDGQVYMCDLIHAVRIPPRCGFRPRGPPQGL